MLSKIFSISSMISGVNLAMIGMAPMLSSICSTLVAPRMTVLTLGFLAPVSYTHLTLPTKRIV